jgi:hypothetical protein
LPNTNLDDLVTKAATEICPLCAGTGWKAVDGLATRSGKTERHVTRARRAALKTLGDRIGERMRSRLHETCRIIALDGTDFRQKFRSASFR